MLTYALLILVQCIEITLGLLLQMAGPRLHWGSTTAELKHVLIFHLHLVVIVAGHTLHYIALAVALCLRLHEGAVLMLHGR